MKRHIFNTPSFMPIRVSCKAGGLFCALLFVCTMGSLRAQTTITTTGTYTIPAGVTSIRVEAIGGGAAGGYSNNSGQTTGGGGGGAYARVDILTVTPGETLDIIVGGGGSGSSGASNGGSSSVQRGSNIIVLAVGGTGVANNTTSGGQGGQDSDCIGSVRYSGGNGGNGNGNGGGTSNNSGGGGGGAGRTGAGGNGNNGTGTNNSTGGTGNAPGGNGGQGAKYNFWGATDAYGGNTYGGGGGGAKSPNASGGSRNGGAGAQGVVIITILCYDYILASTSSSLTNAVCQNATATTNITFTGISTTPTGNYTSYLPVGTYTATYTVTTPAGTTNTYTANVNVTTTAGVNTAGTISNITIPAASVGTVTIKITKLETGSCNNVISANNEINITVNPLPVLTLTTTTKAICSGSTVPDPGLSSTIAGTTYTITSVSNGVTGATVSVSGATTFPADVLTCTTATTGTVTYTITPVVNGCAGIARTYTVTVYKAPTIVITAENSATSVCHNQLIKLTATTTGTVDWIGWENAEGNDNDPYNQYTSSWTGYNVVEYNPRTSEAGQIISLSARVNNAGCGYVASSPINLQILPLTTTASLVITNEPQGFQDLCETVSYTVRLTATGAGDLTNGVLSFVDVDASEITIESDAVVTPSTGNPNTVSGTATDNKMMWNIGNITGGDSVDVTVSVTPRCGFYGGSSYDFTFNAKNVCEEDIDGETKSTQAFLIAQENRNSYNVTSSFYDKNYNPVTKVNNSTGDTIIWHVRVAISDYKTAPDPDKEEINILFPNGLTNVIDYNPINNAPLTTGGWTNTLQPDGDNYSAPLSTGMLTVNDTMIFEFTFTASEVPCKIYQLYVTTDYQFDDNCEGASCSFHDQTGVIRPTLTVQRYNFDIVVENSTIIDNQWSGQLTFTAKTPLYAGDDISINLYAEDDPTLLAATTYTTTGVEGGTFGKSFSNIPFVHDKQLVAEITGNALCDSITIPIATMYGIAGVCQNDTVSYYTLTGMQNYGWDVDAVSGATPIRIPAEGHATVEEAPHIARIIWREPGDFQVWSQYSLPASPPQELSKTYFPVHVVEKPTIVFADEHSLFLCAGEAYDIGATVTAATTFLWSNFNNEAGTAIGETTTTLQYQSFKRTTDTTFYIYLTVFSAEGSPCGDIKDSISVTIYGKPAFTFEDATDCGYMDLTTLQPISGDVTGLTMSYWNSDFSINITGSANSITQSGTYHIIGENSNHCSDTTKINVVITPIPVLTLTKTTETTCSGMMVPDPGLTPDISVENGTTYTISSIATGTNGNTLSVSGLTSFVDDTLECTGTTAGTVIYTIIPVFAGCPGTAQTYTVTVIPNPSFSFSDPDPVCEPNTVDITNLVLFSGDTTGLNFEYWNSDYSNELTQEEASAVNVPGVYNVVGINTTNCSDTSTVRVVIKALPTVSITGSDSICVGTQTQLSPSEGGSWVSNNPSVASVTNDGFVMGIAIGSATFTFTSSTTGCSNTTDTIPIGAFPIVDAITGERNVCINATIQLSCTSSGGVWTLSNANAQIIGSSDDNPVEIKGVASGQTHVSYTLGTGTCRSTSTWSLKIVPALSPEIIIGFEK